MGTAAEAPAAVACALRAGLRFGLAITLALLAAHLLAGCGGGGDDPDVATPTVPCVDRPEVCK